MSQSKALGNVFKLRTIVDATDPAIGLSTSGTAAANTTALAALATKVNTAAAAIVIIPPGTYQFNGAIDNSVLCQFTSLKGVSILAPGVVLADQTAYAGIEYCYLFGFNACSNISIPPGLKITSANNMPNLRGLKAFQFGQGCSGIDLWWEQDGGLTGVEFYRAYTDAASYRTKNYRLHGKVSNVFYPVNGQHSGDLGEVWIDTVNCGRNFFFYGARGVTIHNDQKNQQSTANLSAYNGYGCEDFKVFIRNRESTDCVAAAPVLGIYWVDTTAATHRNINVTFDVDNPAGDPFGSTLAFGKYDGAGGADSTGRGHVLDGLIVKGISEQTTGRNHFGATAGAFVTSGTPDVLRNIKVENFTASGASVNDDWSTIIAALSGRMLLSNAHYTDTNLVIANGLVGRVVFVGCTAPNFSATTGDNDAQDLISCNIVSGLQQAALGRRFIRTPWASAAINSPSDGEWIIPAYSAGSYTASTGTWTVDAGDVSTLAYTVIGKTMTVQFDIKQSDVSATPTSLRIAIPGGYVAAKTMVGSVPQISDAGGAFISTGSCAVTTSGTVIDIFKDAAGTAFTATTGDNTRVIGSITFEVS